MSENYRAELDKKLSEISLSGERPSLLLHSCCGPCSSAVLEYLCPYFDVSVFYYNPNMDTKEEYLLRLENQRRIIEQLPQAAGVKLIDGGYDHDEFLRAVSGKENEPEGGERCAACFELRLKATLERAADYDYFTTTLTVSPHKNAVMINSIGSSLENGGTKYLLSDFKKKEGYKRSIELARQYSLYRQTYCGCEYSKNKP